MKKHTFSEMLKTYADATELSIFGKYKDGSWYPASEYDILCCKFIDFYLCQPENYDLCYKWLNGAKVQRKTKEGYYPIPSINEWRWYPSCYFMLNCYELSLAPNWYNKLDGTINNGVLCNCYDTGHNDKEIHLVVRYDITSKYFEYPFITDTGRRYSCAEPINGDLLNLWIQNTESVNK